MISLRADRWIKRGLDGLKQFAGGISLAELQAPELREFMAAVIQATGLNRLGLALSPWAVGALAVGLRSLFRGCCEPAVIAGEPVADGLISCCAIGYELLALTRWLACRLCWVGVELWLRGIGISVCCAGLLNELHQGLFQLDLNFNDFLLRAQPLLLLPHMLNGFVEITAAALQLAAPLRGGVDHNALELDHLGWLSG